MEFPTEKFIEDLRMSVLDIPEENELLLDFEFKKELIELCLRRAVNRINSTPPIFSGKVTLDKFSKPEDYLTLIPGVLGYAYAAKGIQEKRNEIQYSDESQGINEDHRCESYLQFSQMQLQEFDEKIRNAKLRVNEELGFGEAFSSTLFLRYFY